MTDILVINPNSTVAVTEGLDRAVQPMRLPGAPAIRCVTLSEGPPGIQSQRDIEAVTGPLCRLIATESAEETASAFVIACFSDPGLFAAREVTDKPVVGIMEAGMLTAMSLGQRVGVVAILPQSIPRHIRAFRAMGAMDRVVGERPLGLAVVELADESRTQDRLLATARTLVHQDGADVVVLGCAGMARYRPMLEADLAVPVVDPTQAAVGFALTAMQFGLRPRRF
ncbi:MAG: aspartate/glutamate racemase family protein [Alphaproteobacteria bacterium]|nr:aspartate/glutamate racemase family protein [Alphaproteobacteria bacterium]